MNLRYILRILGFTILLLFSSFINNTFLYYLPFIMIHELVHCITGAFLGYSIKSIRMLPFGITASFNEEFIKPQDDILISISGPLINFIFFVLFSSISHWNIHFFMLGQSNLIICVFNLIPAGFLDGGRILKNLLKINVSFYSAYSINNINGIILGCLIITAAMMIPISFNSIIIIIMGIYFIYTGYVSQKEIIINIVKDSINKLVYFKKINRYKEHTIVLKNDSKLLIVMKSFCFKKHYTVYLVLENRLEKVLEENDIMKAYMESGNIMMSEVIK